MHQMMRRVLMTRQGIGAVGKTLAGGLVALGAGATALTAYLTILLPWQHRWGATDDELRRELPGDELVPGSDLHWTRAITVRARDTDIWPWLVQIGAGRSGYYGYPWLEMLMGLRVARPLRINPAWQKLDRGDVIPAEADGTGYRVVAVTSPRVLVLGAQDADACVPRSFKLLYHAFSWAFVLENAQPGETRVIMRMRAHLRRFPPIVLATYIVDFGAFFLKRRMLISLKQLAEATCGQQAR